MSGAAGLTSELPDALVHVGVVFDAVRVAVRRVDVGIAAVEPSFAIGLIVGVAVGVAVLEVLD